MKVAENSAKKNYAYSEVNQELKDKFTEKEKCSESGPAIGFRHLQVFLYFLLGFIAFGFRSSLSVAIVAMTDPLKHINPDIPTYPEWNDKNVVLSAFFWGYMLPQMFAGWAASRFGAKWFLVGTFSIQSILGFMVPFFAANFGSKGVMFSRALQGLCQGFIYPSLTHLLSQWAPTEERSFLGNIVFAAGACGTVVAIFITGFISASWYGWPAVFYLYGVLGVSWCILMIIFGYDSPAIHPNVSDEEKLYIESSLGHTDEKASYPTPWKYIFTSLPLFALFLAQFGSNYCFWTLLTQIPTYMHSVMNFDIKDNSVLSSLPYLTQWLLSFFFGFVSDKITNNGLLTITASRKVFNSIGLFGSAIPLIILGYTRPDQTTQGVILLTVSVGLGAAGLSGWCINHMDLSPNHAGTLMGLCNGVSQISGAASPLIVQFFVTDLTDPVQWRTIFLLTAGINIGTAGFYAIFGSGKVQPWNSLERHEKV